jgi:hypothetical protein
MTRLKFIALSALLALPLLTGTLGQGAAEAKKAASIDELAIRTL